MCFDSPSPPPVPPPDPAVEAQKQASFEQNAQRIAEEKRRMADDARSRAYGFYGVRSLMGTDQQSGSRSLTG